MARKTRHIRARDDEWVVVHRNRALGRGADYSWLWLVVLILVLVFALPGWVWMLILLAIVGFPILSAIKDCDRRKQ